MKLNGPVLSIVLVIGLTVVITAYRVSTAPERVRQRQESARTSCLNAGGEWVKIDNDESCLTAAQRKKI